MEMIAKIMFGLIVGALVFTDKIPTEQKKDKDNSGLFLIFIIAAVALMFAVCKQEV